MDFIDQIGSRAYLSVNVGSGSPQEAAEWLEYLTAAQPTALQKERAANGHPEPYTIPYLGIGNENWDCGGNMTPEYYLQQLKTFARYSRNFNPAQRDGAARMLKIAVGPGGGGPRWTEWTEVIMKGWKARQWSWDMDGLSLHNYTVVSFPPKFPSVGFDEADYARILQAAVEMDGLITTHSAIMDKYDPEKKIALVVDEWGAWYAPLPGSTPGFLAQQNSVRDALIASLHINIFARHADRVRMANIAQMVNVLQAMILTDKEKMILTPTYHVFRMYVPFQDATFVPVTFDAGAYTHGNITLPRVDAMAARDAGRHALARPHEHRSEAPGGVRHAAHGNHREDRDRRDRDGAGHRQRQHVRGAEHGVAEANHGDDRGRPALGDARAEVCDGPGGAPMSRLPAGTRWLLPAALAASPLHAQVQTEVPPPVAGAKPVTVERIKVHGAALEGNLEGNAADRDVLVFLPPSYATQKSRRYPVVYALHGYSIGAEQWSKEIHVPQTIEGAFALGAREMIVVLPDSKTRHNGSMYSSSPTIGDFEQFVARDLVSYIDAHYRTLANRNSRGLVGHSMGGYGATRIGMKHADVFGSLYIMSPCCLSPRGPGQPTSDLEKTLANAKGPEDVSGLPFGARAQLAAAAAWAPNPQAPPFYLDLPTKDGAPQADVLARFAANSPLAFIDQWIGNLRRYRAIAIDVGDQDGLRADSGKLHDALDRYKIANTFEIYPGTHTSKMADRFQNHVIPFFHRTLCHDKACK